MIALPNTTRFTCTGRRPTIVAPLTAVIAPGTEAFEYRAGGAAGRVATSTANGWL